MNIDDLAVQASLAEFVRNWHCPADAHRVQNGGATCRHVFVQQDRDRFRGRYVAADQLAPVLVTDAKLARGTSSVLARLHGWLEGA